MNPRAGVARWRDPLSTLIPTDTAFFRAGETRSPRGEMTASLPMIPTDTMDIGRVRKLHPTRVIGDTE